MPALKFRHFTPSYRFRTILPKHCTLCRIFVRPEAGRVHSLSLCNDCLLTLPAIATVCPGCGLPYALKQRSECSVASSGPLCGRCLKSPTCYDDCLAALPYMAPVSGLITQFKYSSRFDLGRLLAGLLARQLIQAGAMSSAPNCLLPVPLHWRRQLQRGYNQSVLLAHYLRTDLLGQQSHEAPMQGQALAVNARLLRRRVNTATQTKQKMAARQSNVKDAFAMRQRQAVPPHVAIIDDVVTTGATVNEISRVLKEAGVQRVSVWCVARTPA